VKQLHGSAKKTRLNFADEDTDAAEEKSRFIMVELTNDIYFKKVYKTLTSRSSIWAMMAASCSFTGT
jgi:hypothetical protein